MSENSGPAGRLQKENRSYHGPVVDTHAQTERTGTHSPHRFMQISLRHTRTIMHSHGQTQNRRHLSASLPAREHAAASDLWRAVLRPGGARNGGGRRPGPLLCRGGTPGRVQGTEAILRSVSSQPSQRLNLLCFSPPPVSPLTTRYLPLSPPREQARSPRTRCPSSGSTAWVFGKQRSSTRGRPPRACPRSPSRSSSASLGRPPR